MTLPFEVTALLIDQPLTVMANRNDFIPRFVNWLITSGHNGAGIQFQAEALISSPV